METERLAGLNAEQSLLEDELQRATAAAAAEHELRRREEPWAMRLICFPPLPQRQMFQWDSGRGYQPSLNRRWAHG